MKNLLKVLLILFCSFGCNDDDHICLPNCLIDEIGFLGEHQCDDSANIAQYRFQKSIVYLIDPGYCADDQSYEVFNSDCEVIGQLGGFVGNEEINGLNFYKHAELIKIVWEK
jgi:hypothetical protein